MSLTFVVRLAVGRREVEEVLLLLVERERLLADPDRPVAEVRAVDLALLAQPGQQLHRLHGIAPLVVATPELVMTSAIVDN